MIRTAEQKLPNGFTWDDYKKLVFDLTTGDVFDNSWEGIAKIMTYNIFEGYFLDNTPLRKYLEPWIKKMNYSQFGDLYIPTAISLVNQSSGNSHRFWSTDPRYRNINLLDMIMGSASLPIAFSPMKIDGLGDTIWIDGLEMISSFSFFWFSIISYLVWFFKRRNRNRYNSSGSLDPKSRCN